MAGGILQASDWSLAGSWSSAAKPTDNDHAIVPGTLNADVTMSLDEGGVDCNLIEIHHLFSRRVGTSAAPIAICTDLLRVYGSNGFYFDCDHDDAANHIVDVTVLKCPNRNTPVELGSKAPVAAVQAHWDRIMASRCNLTMKSNTYWAATGVLDVGYVSNPRDDVRVALAAGGQTLPLLRQNGGRVESDIIITDAQVKGGTLVQDTVTPTLVHVYDGATLVLNHTAATTIYVHDGGMLDLMQNAQEKTLTNLFLSPAANILWVQNTTNTPGLHTVTNLWDYRGSV